MLALPAVRLVGAFVLWTQLAHGKGWTWMLVAVAVVALLRRWSRSPGRREGWAFVLTTIAVVATVALLFGSLFPNLMPSTLDPD